MGRDEKIGREGGRGGKIEILSTSTSTQIPEHKTSHSGELSHGTSFHAGFMI